MKDIDNEIMKFLENDSRTPFLQIAKKLNVSEGTIRKRVSNMRENGNIKKFTIKRGKDSNIIMGIQTDPQMPTKNIVDKILTYGVEKVYELTGRFDAICHINSPDMEAANDIVEQIRTTEGIKHTETFMVLKESS